MRFTIPRGVAAGVAALLVLPAGAGGQSRYKLSVQGSGLYANVTGDAYRAIDLSSGVGFELQARVTPGAWSVGAGYQRTSHSAARGDWTLSGPFVEPRYVVDVGSDLLAPYVSGRFSVLKLDGSYRDVSASSSGVTLNAGGGVLVSLNQLGVARRVNVDLGATYGYTRFGDYTQSSGGQSVSSASLGAGQNVVLRVGLAVGLGGG